MGAGRLALHEYGLSGDFRIKIIAAGGDHDDYTAGGHCIQRCEKLASVLITDAGSIEQGLQAIHE